MAETLTSSIVPKVWTKLASISIFNNGEEAILQNTGLQGDVIEIAFSDSQPLETLKGIQLDQLRSYYQIPASTLICWVRYTRLDKREDLHGRTGLLQVMPPITVTPYIQSFPSSALVTDGYGGYRLRVSNEEAIVNSAFNGNVFTVSGVVTLGGNESISLNFNVTERLLHVSSVANSQAEIELSVHNEASTGTILQTLFPFNRNLQSQNTTTVTVDVIQPATPQGALVDFGTDRLGRSVITGPSNDFAVIIARRDAGSSQQVKFAATFEILPDEPAQPEPVLFNGEQLTYNAEDLFYVP